MKRVIFLPAAQRALLRHRNVASKIMTKIDSLAANPEAFTNMVTELKGSRARRFRIGGYRVIFEETDSEIVVTAIGPGGSIYE